MRRILGAAVLLCLLAVASAGGTRAQEHSSDATNEANNPLTPKITVNFQDYYVPSIIGTHGRDANQFLFRGLVPMKTFDVPQLLRFTLPLVTSPTFPHGSDTGIGDLTLMDLFMFPGKEVSFGIGPMLVFPTAGKKTLGSGKWQVGAAAVVVAPQHWGLLGGLITYQQSFAGDDDRRGVKLLTMQPIAFYNLPHGFYLRSSATWNFDFKNDSNFIPIGFGVGKVFLLGGGVTMNTFVEPQYTVLRHGTGMPRWQIFMGVNFQFAL